MNRTTTFKISIEDKPDWLQMRPVLWADLPPEAHITEKVAILSDPMQPVFVAVRENGRLCGILKAGTQRFVVGCQTSTVCYGEYLSSLEPGICKNREIGTFIKEVGRFHIH